MKKLILFFLSCFPCFTLFACTNNEEKANTEPALNKEETFGDFLNNSVLPFMATSDLGIYNAKRDAINIKSENFNSDILKYYEDFNFETDRPTEKEISAYEQAFFPLYYLTLKNKPQEKKFPHPDLVSVIEANEDFIRYASHAPAASADISTYDKIFFRCNDMLRRRDTTIYNAFYFSTTTNLLASDFFKLQLKDFPYNSLSGAFVSYSADSSPYGNHYTQGSMFMFDFELSNNIATLKIKEDFSNISYYTTLRFDSSEVIYEKELGSFRSTLFRICKTTNSTTLTIDYYLQLTYLAEDKECVTLNIYLMRVCDNNDFYIVKGISNDRVSSGLFDYVVESSWHTYNFCWF